MFIFVYICREKIETLDLEEPVDLHVETIIDDSGRKEMLSFCKWRVTEGGVEELW